MKFYLGLHNPADAYRIGDIPYMVSVRQVLRRRKSLPGHWLLDSGGFSELSLFGYYTFSRDEYVDCIMRLNPYRAFCQDWMCEDEALKKTGKTVKEHQELTIISYLSLRVHLQGKITPVLQGRTIQDYLDHLEMYGESGIPNNILYGVGSICRRNKTMAPYWIFVALREYAPQIKLHAFGLKISAFKHVGVIKNLESADSNAWSFRGRKIGRTNDINFALEWREKVLKIINETVRKPEQGILL